MTDQLAVACQDASTITFFTTDTWEPTTVLDVVAQPHELLFDHDRRLLLCSHAYRSGFYGDFTERAHEISLIDPDTHQVVDVIDVPHAPHGLALKDNLLHVSVEASEHEEGGIVVVDLDKRKVVDRFDVHAGGPHWVTLNGDKAYTSNKEARFVTSVDLGTKATERIEVPGSEGIASDGRRYVYVSTPVLGAQGVDRGVRVIDTEVDRVVRILPTEEYPMPVHVTGDLVLVGENSLSGNGFLSVFRDFERVARIEVGRFPLTLESSPDGRVAYVSNLMSGTVSIVDLAGLAVVKELDLATPGTAGPHGLAYLS
ncbi:YncE family protein [Saccharothrix variisporea]|uniref:YVTN family beta-propeller protein n=1 Tax=Saccharothrix variisporea TaxID=543527 RepID=A0A495X5F4_9PSEU|nr:YncE family protein [Saccharothrix variisporea]RKT68445.1 YVTN family beta-propeller protein [Saccharothrix variisporea]